MSNLQTVSVAYIMAQERSGLDFHEDVAEVSIVDGCLLVKSENKTTGYPLSKVTSWQAALQEDSDETL